VTDVPTPDIKTSASVGQLQNTISQQVNIKHLQQMRALQYKDFQTGTREPDYQISLRKRMAERGGMNLFDANVDDKMNVDSTT